MCRMMPGHVRKANMVCSWCVEEPKVMCWECAEPLVIIEDVVLKVKGPRQEPLPKNEPYEPHDWEQYSYKPFRGGILTSEVLEKFIRDMNQVRWGK
jgi:hypothetical protein